MAPGRLGPALPEWRKTAGWRVGSRRVSPSWVPPGASGKTTFLHLLDEALQLHAEAPLVYVVKGNPDGTGRYLFHAPRLREALKPRVKGAWSAVTVSTIGEWIDRCRSRLELVLVDLGGRQVTRDWKLATQP